MRAAIVLLLCLSSYAAAAEEVPKFNIDATCRAAPRLAGEDTDPYQSCVQDETDARDRLEKNWAGFDPRQREECVRETSVEGFPSFVEVLTCIEMASGLPPSAQHPRRRSP